MGNIPKTTSKPSTTSWKLSVGFSTMPTFRHHPPEECNSVMMYKSLSWIDGSVKRRKKIKQNVTIPEVDRRLQPENCEVLNNATAKENCEVIVHCPIKHIPFRMSICLIIK